MTKPLFKSVRHDGKRRTVFVSANRRTLPKGKVSEVSSEDAKILQSNIYPKDVEHARDYERRDYQGLKMQRWG